MSAIQSERPAIASVLLTANCAPSFRYPNHKKGTFKINIKTEMEILVVSATSMDIPVTPPSIKWLDNKKPFKPMPALNMPNKISIASLSMVLAFISKYRLSRSDFVYSNLNISCTGDKRTRVMQNQQIFPCMAKFLLKMGIIFKLTCKIATPGKPVLFKYVNHHRPARVFFVPGGFTFNHQGKINRQTIIMIRLPGFGVSHNLSWSCTALRIQFITFGKSAQALGNYRVYARRCSLYCFVI